MVGIDNSTPILIYACYSLHEDYTSAILQCSGRLSNLASILTSHHSGGSRGVPWVPWNPALEGLPLKIM